MTESLEVVIAAGDVPYLVSVLRGEMDADDVDLIGANGTEIGLQPALFEHITDDGEVLIEVRPPRYHLMGGCSSTLAGKIADSIDGSSGVQVPVMLSYPVCSAPGSEFDEVAVFFVAERR
jgi:hypothetical protein